MQHNSHPLVAVLRSPNGVYYHFRYLFPHTGGSIEHWWNDGTGEQTVNEPVLLQPAQAREVWKDLVAIGSIRVG